VGFFGRPQTLIDHLLASAALQQQTALHENSRRDWKCGEAVGLVSGLGMQQAPD
jgi:hypothetical protein